MENLYICTNIIKRHVDFFFLGIYNVKRERECINIDTGYLHVYMYVYLSIFIKIQQHELFSLHLFLYIFFCICRKEYTKQLGFAYEM